MKLLVCSECGLVLLVKCKCVVFCRMMIYLLLGWLY